MTARPDPPRPPRPGRARIFVLDDHPVLRRGVRDLVEGAADLEVVGDSGDPADLLDAVKEGHVDVAVVDLSLSERSGLALVREIAARDGDAPHILVLSMHDDRYYAERCLRAGASGYVNKAEAGERFMDAVRKVLRGGIAVSDALEGRPWRDAVKGRDVDPDPVQRLSDREMEVFVGYGEGRSSREIAAWLGVSVKTVETHRAHIKDKLGLASGPGFVAYAVRWRTEHA